MPISYNAKNIINVIEKSLYKQTKQHYKLKPYVKNKTQIHFIRSAKQNCEWTHQSNIQEASSVDQYSLVSLAPCPQDKTTRSRVRLGDAVDLCSGRCLRRSVALPTLVGYGHGTVWSFRPINMPTWLPTLLLYTAKIFLLHSFWCASCFIWIYVFFFILDV